MPARLTAYLPESAASVRILDGAGPWTIGRDPASDFALDHASVSRRHARIDLQDAACLLTDLGSKNGSWLDGSRVSEVRIAQDCWLRFGDVYCEYEALDAAQAQLLAERASQRRATSAVLQQRAAAAPDFDGMLQETLRAAIELCGCERGFLLLAGGDGLAVRAAAATDAAAVAGGAFRGSIGAVERAMSSLAPVVVNDTGGAPWLAARGSVVRAGIRALACVPLRGHVDGSNAQPAAGALYIDSRAARARISELDVELLVAFVDAMALRIAARAAAEDLGRLAGGAVPWQAWLQGRGAAA